MDTRGWNTAGSEDSIHELLTHLGAADPGDDVDLVIGLAGAVPRFEDSFHEVGIATVVGKHLVLRPPRPPRAPASRRRTSSSTKPRSNS